MKFHQDINLSNLYINISETKHYKIGSKCPISHLHHHTCVYMHTYTHTYTHRYNNVLICIQNVQIHKGECYTGETISGSSSSLGLKPFLNNVKLSCKL